MISFGAGVFIENMTGDLPTHKTNIAPTTISLICQTLDDRNRTVAPKWNPGLNFSCPTGMFGALHDQNQQPRREKQHRQYPVVNFIQSTSGVPTLFKQNQLVAEFGGDYAKDRTVK